MSEYKLVPKEPTPEMERAGDNLSRYPVLYARDIYRAMLAAAPAPEWVAVSERLPQSTDALGDRVFVTDGEFVGLCNFMDVEDYWDYWMPITPPEPPQ